VGIKLGHRIKIARSITKYKEITAPKDKDEQNENQVVGNSPRKVQFDQKVSIQTVETQNQSKTEKSKQKDVEQKKDDKPVRTIEYNEFGEKVFV